MRGKLKSWACPKGIPYRRGEKHLAVRVEDHPAAYADFEGVIPKKQYGGGTVMVWDQGRYEPLTPFKDLEKGKFHFLLHGKKLDGEWYLVRFKKSDNQWLLIKGGESVKPVSKNLDDLSVLSGRTMKELSQTCKPKKNVISNRRLLKGPNEVHFVRPMMAKLKAAPPPSSDGWLYEIKFDGWRALALKGDDEVRLVSRNENDLSEKFPEIVAAVAQIKVRDAILDGEIVALNKNGVSSFQLLQAYDLGEKRPPIYYYVFDLLQLNGIDLKKRPIEERKALLAKLNFPDEIRLSNNLGCDAQLILKKTRRLGIEGLIGKKTKSTYLPGVRSVAWIKLRLTEEQEFVIGGYTNPRGGRPFFGSVMVGYYQEKKLIFAGKVGTGFGSKLLRSLYERFQAIAQSKCPFAHLPLKEGRSSSITTKELRSSHWVKPRLVCQVRFKEWTRDGQLRQPVFLGLREDKNAAEVTREKPD